MFEAFFGFTGTPFSRDISVSQLLETESGKELQAGEAQSRSLLAGLHGRLQEVRMVTEKLRLQQEIRDRFGDWQIQARQQSLCQRCISFCYQHCEYSLLPVTSEGSDCPYYRDTKQQLGVLSPEWGGQ